MATTLLMACSNDEVIRSIDDEQQAQIQLSSTMETMLTRAADALQETSINTSSTPGVYVYRTTKTAIDNSYGYENIAATVGTGGVLSTSTMYYPQDKGSVDVYVYAPRTTSSPSMTAMPITVATDQSAAAGYLASDFIYGKATAAFPTTFPAGPINVTLKHALCKIKLNIQAGTGSSAIANADVTEVKLGDGTTNPYLSTTVNLTDATLASAVATATSGTTGIVQFANALTAQATVAAILPPQTLTNCPLSVKIGSATYTATLSSPTGGFTAGNEYIYTVKVNVEGIAITAISIATWNSINVPGDIDVQ